jgi:hypothetical protein
MQINEQWTRNPTQATERALIIVPWRGCVPRYTGTVSLHMLRSTYKQLSRKNATTVTRKNKYHLYRHMCLQHSRCRVKRKCHLYGHRSRVTGLRSPFSVLRSPLRSGSLTPVQLCPNEQVRLTVAHIEWRNAILVHELDNLLQGADWHRGVAQDLPEAVATVTDHRRMFPQNAVTFLFHCLCQLGAEHQVFFGSNGSEFVQRSRVWCDEVRETSTFCVFPSHRQLLVHLARCGGQCRAREHSAHAHHVRH